MAREARVKSSTGIYAIILRSDTDIFKTKSLRNAFLTSAEKYLGNGMMGVRFHSAKAEMLIKESEKGISMDMKPLITSFARTYNKTTNSCGKVFSDRFKSIPVEDDTLLNECMTYMSGGKTASPYRDGVKRAFKKITPQKPEADTKPKEEPKPEIKRRQNTMPTWLL